MPEGAGDREGFPAERAWAMQPTKAFSPDGQASRANWPQSGGPGVTPPLGDKALSHGTPCFVTLTHWHSPQMTAVVIPAAPVPVTTRGPTGEGSPPSPREDGRPELNSLVLSRLTPAWETCFPGTRLAAQGVANLLEAWPACSRPQRPQPGRFHGRRKAEEALVF